MAEFKWHLMAEEVPENGNRDYLLAMGAKGNFNVARGHSDGWRGSHFYGCRGELPIVYDNDVYAWAEIPPLEDE